MPTLLDTPKGVGGKIDRKTNTLLTAPPAQGAITSQSLAPSASFNLQPPKPATEATGFEGYMEANANQLSQQRQQVQQSKDDFLTTLLKSDTETGLQSKMYAEQVDPLEQELNDINQEILAEQHSTRRQIEALQKNPQGMFGGALQDRIDEIQTKSISKQADLAVIQLSRQGKFDSAKRIADRAVSAILEKQKLRNEALMFNYQENKSLFDKNEQRIFEYMQGERERSLANEEYRLRAEFDQKIKQSDPLYQANLNKTYAEIARIRADAAANGPQSAKAQQKLQSQVNKAETVIGKVGQALNQITGPFSGLGRTGFIGGLAKHLPGSNAYTLDKTLDTIKANLGFDALQEMRDNSPTGGALGQVAVQELNMLQAAVSALDTGLPGDILQQNLAEVQKHYTNWLNLVGYELAPDGKVIEITN